MFVWIIKLIDNVYLVFSVTEVSFDERIALELDALDQLGTVESPVVEQPMISFQRQQLDGSNFDVDDNNDQQQTLSRSDVRRKENLFDRQVLDCDEVRIMIKVLGSKVCGLHYVFMFFNRVMVCMVCFLMIGVWRTVFGQVKSHWLGCASCN